MPKAWECAQGRGSRVPGQLCPSIFGNLRCLTCRLARQSAPQKVKVGDCLGGTFALNTRFPPGPPAALAGLEEQLADRDQDLGGGKWARSSFRAVFFKHFACCCWLFSRTHTRFSCEILCWTTSSSGVEQTFSKVERCHLHRGNGQNDVFRRAVVGLTSGDPDSKVAHGA